MQQTSVNAIFESLACMSQDEQKHFILKNQDYFEAIKLDTSGKSSRHQADEYSYELDCDKLTLPNLIQLASDCTAYVDKYYK